MRKKIPISKDQLEELLKKNTVEEAAGCLGVSIMTVNRRISLWGLQKYKKRGKEVSQEPPKQTKEIQEKFLSEKEKELSSLIKQEKIYSEGGRCDSLSGPCSCGQWHTQDQISQRITGIKIPVQSRSPASFSESDLPINLYSEYKNSGLSFRDWCIKWLMEKELKRNGS